MKLVIAFVQDADSLKLRDELARAHFSSTKLASTGGFLRQGNTTFLIGVEAERLKELKDLLRDVCQERIRLTPMRSYLEGAEGVAGDLVEVVVGGAVVFVVPLEAMFRL